MRLVIVLILVLGTLGLQKGEKRAIETVKEGTQSEPLINIIFDLVIGILEGMNENYEYVHTLSVISHIIPYYEKIIKLFEELKKLDWKNLEHILGYFIEVSQFTTQLLEWAVDLIKGIAEIEHLIIKLGQLDIDKVMQRAIKHSFTIFKLLCAAMEQIRIPNYKESTKMLGEALYLLLFKDALGLDTKTLDFLRGFLEGLNESGDFNELLKCVSDLETVIDKIIAAIELICKFTFEDIFKGFKMLIEAISELFQKLRPCADSFKELKKLVDAITHTDILTLVKKLMANPGPYLHDLLDCLESFKRGDFRRAGQDLGDVLFRLFLEKLLAITFEDIVKLISGFMEGINRKQGFHNLEDCIKNVPSVVDQIVQLIDELKKVDWTNADQMLAMLRKVFAAFQNILASLKDCANVPEDIEALVQKLKNLDLEQLQQRLNRYMFQIVMDVYSILASINDKKFMEIGRGLGDICYLLILKD